MTFNIPSSRRKPGGGFTFEVQQLFNEDLSGGVEVKTLSGSIVIDCDEVIELAVVNGGEIGLSGKKSACTSDGVFDAALLPGRMRVAEVGLESKVVEQKVARELCAVVKGDGLAERLGHKLQNLPELACDEVCRLVGGSLGNEDTRSSLMQGEDGLPVFGEQHEIGFPMSGNGAGVNDGGTLSDGHPLLNEVCGASALMSAKATLGLGAGQIVAPGIVVVAGDLGIDEAVDGLVADEATAVLQPEPAGHLFGRQAIAEAFENQRAKLAFAFKLGAGPPSGAGLLFSLGRLVSLGSLIAPQLARDARWRATQSCSNLPERTAFGVKSGNLAAVFQ